ncbi:hypothetical protein NQZ79_g1015 [Umbelopsis isabellina]|nr:hypothetical protein NQZ79_g1015 [Umbelopsis isabellina]
MNKISGAAVHGVMLFLWSGLVVFSLVGGFMGHAEEGACTVWASHNVYYFIDDGRSLSNIGNCAAFQLQKDLPPFISSGHHSSPRPWVRQIISMHADRVADDNNTRLFWWKGISLF